MTNPNCDEFNKLLTEGLDEEYRIVDWTDCACGRIHCKHANGEWMTVRQSTPEEDEAVNRSLGLLADLDKSIADITAPEKPGGFSQEELASAEAALSERGEWETDRAAIDLHAASGDEDDLREACDMIQKVRKAETNGEALFAVVSYRKAIREKLLAEPQPDSRGWKPPREFTTGDDDLNTLLDLTACFNEEGRWNHDTGMQWLDALEKVEAKLAASSVAPGWKLVPLEPTKAMIDAAGTPGVSWIAYTDLAFTVWRAMLSAAPAFNDPNP